MALDYKDRRDDVEYNGDDDDIEVQIDLIAFSGHHLLEALNLSSSHLLLLPLLPEQKYYDVESDDDWKSRKRMMIKPA